MKHEMIKQQNSAPEQTDPQASTSIPGFRAGGVGGSGNVGSGKKSQRHPRWIVAATGAALCLSLSACFFPNDGYVGRGATYTTYQPGYRTQALPAGYRSEVISGSTYYYDNGNYYRRDPRGYVVVDAPRNSRYYGDYGQVRQGREVNSRRNQRIYDRNNALNRDGELIPRLPSGHRVVNHRGQRYYQVDDRYYVRDQSGYVRVRNPY